MSDVAMTPEAELRESIKDAVWTELIDCYGEGEDTDWAYLTDLCDLIVSMIQKHGPRVGGDERSEMDILTQVELALAEVYTPEGMAIWMKAEHKQWDGWTVSEMLNHGRGDEVLQVIDQLASGAFG